MFFNSKHQNQQKLNGGQFWSPFSFLLFFVILMFNNQLFAETNTSSPIKAWFNIILESNSLIVLPTCISDKNSMVHYEISATKMGPSGHSQNSQGGQVLLQPEQKTILSNLQFGLNPNDRYQFNMKIFSNNSLLTSVEAHYP